MSTGVPQQRARGNKRLLGSHSHNHGSSFFPLPTVTFRGVAPDALRAADTGAVVLAQGIAQLAAVFSQRAHRGGVEGGLGVLHRAGHAAVDLCGEMGHEQGQRGAWGSVAAARGPHPSGSASRCSPRGTCTQSPRRGPRRSHRSHMGSESKEMALERAEGTGMELAGPKAAASPPQHVPEVVWG